MPTLPRPSECSLKPMDFSVLLMCSSISETPQLRVWFLFVFMVDFKKLCDSVSFAFILHKLVQLPSQPNGQFYGSEWLQLLFLSRSYETRMHCINTSRLGLSQFRWHLIPLPHMLSRYYIQQVIPHTWSSFRVRQGGKMAISQNNGQFTGKVKKEKQEPGTVGPLIHKCMFGTDQRHLRTGATDNTSIFFPSIRKEQPIYF